MNTLSVTNNILLYYKYYTNTQYPLTLNFQLGVAQANVL